MTDDEDPRIFGCAEVQIEKDSVKREWRVFNITTPPRLLCTVPWKDALREWSEVERKQWPDYTRAVTTCAQSDVGLTEEEEAALQETSAPANGRDDPTASNVLRIDFEKRRRV